MNSKLRKAKIPSWQITATFAESFGWFTERIGKNSVILERGNEKIIARRFPNNSWKIEYFQNGKLDDISGITNSENARRELVEMAMSK